MSIKTKYLVLGSLVLLVALFFSGWYLGSSKERKAQGTVVDAQKKEIERLVVWINDTEYQLTKSEQEIASLKELLKQGEIDKAKLKALNLKQTNELTKLKLRIDTLLKDVANNGQVIVIKDTSTINKPQNAILLPFSFARKDKWLDLNGTFSDKGKLDMSLKMTADVDVISGIEKKTKQRTVNILTDNPYLQTVGVRSFKIDEQRPTKVGIGIQIGYGFQLSNPVKMSPYIGAGISWNIIRF